MRVKRVQRARLWRILTTFLPGRPPRPGEAAAPVTGASTTPSRGRARWSLATMKSYRTGTEAGNSSKLRTSPRRDCQRTLASHRGKSWSLAMLCTTRCVWNSVNNTLVCRADRDQITIQAQRNPRERAAIDHGRIWTWSIPAVSARIKRVPSSRKLCQKDQSGF